MTAQPLWPAFAPSHGKGAVARLHPRARLDELHRDLREAKARLREVLQAVADKYEIPARDIDYAIDGYADDLLADLVYGAERDLEHAAEESDPAP